MSLSKDVSHDRIELCMKKSNQEDIWVEISGKNLIHDPAVRGILLNVSDTTERRRAQEEEKKRGAMQSLSENSTDAIFRLGTTGDFYYCNSMFSELSGLSQEVILNSSIHSELFHESLRIPLETSFDEIFASETIINKELTLNKEDDVVVTFQMNVIPEMDEHEELSSVLFVLHDISVQKAIEEKIKSQRDNINQSINYAERIQDTILPSATEIENLFPDSFMLFKPRDIVSGDFPWYHKEGSTIFIAAVDCTGHGVPGALMSLTGHFLLNDVIKQNGDASPAVILDHLDASINATLRQDKESASIKDGMDISLVKICTLNRTLEYAGAYRPFYHFRNNEMTVIKGNKFPIGGGKTYKNKTAFTNHVISYEAGDSLFIFSDGYTDQFGGPKNRKLGTKRTTDLLISYQNKPMSEIGETLEKAYYSWKGDNRQTDDILMFGIRLS